MGGGGEIEWWWVVKDRWMVNGGDVSGKVNGGWVENGRE